MHILLIHYRCLDLKEIYHPPLPKVSCATRVNLDTIIQTQPHGSKKAISKITSKLAKFFTNCAKRWQMFLYITLPLMRGHIIIALVLRSVFAVKEFDTIIAITDAGPNWVTETMNLNIYFNAFEYQYLGEASAKGVIFFFMLIIIQVFLLHFRKREWTY